MAQRQGLWVVITAAILFTIPEFLGPLLVPEYGSIQPIRLTLTLALAGCLLAGFRWARWGIALLIGIGLLMIVVGFNIGVWDTARILYAVLIGGPYLLAMAILFFSSDVEQYFDGSPRRSAV